MWGAVQELLKAKEGEPLCLASVYQVLSEPPYGIKAGILPILILALYQAMRHELALSESGQFVPFLTREVLEGLLKDPKRGSQALPCRLGAEIVEAMRKLLRERFQTRRI
jgi:hypothetical protein